MTTSRKPLLIMAALVLSAGCTTVAAPALTPEPAVPTTPATPVVEIAAHVPNVTPTVETRSGKVQGFSHNGIETYLGLRYGKAPIGDLRFKPPIQEAAWDGIYDATSMGAPAMQMYSPSGPATTDFTRQMQSIFSTAGEAKIDNEDALFLNVWTPGTDDARRPVMVWFHGGGYDYGSGGWPAYDGHNLADKGDVVVITVNHRLNAFGYMYLADKFGPEFAESGNLGNLDLIASLEWVRDNVAAFGGDPANVTIMGESGGGSKVSHLLATPAAKGLFHKAIIQSGAGVTGTKKEVAAAATDEILAEASVKTVEELRTIPADDLLAAARTVVARSGDGFSRGIRFGPVVDGTVLPRDPFMPEAPDQSVDVPVMIGWNKDEMTLFTASQPWFGRLDDDGLDKMAAALGETGPALVAAYRAENPDYDQTHIVNRAMTARFVQGSYIIADQKTRKGGAPVYMYRLTWETPVNGGIFKTPHTLDIPFMFDNVEVSRVLVGPGDEPQKLADMMSDAWISFARTGTPSSDLLPDWPVYTVEARSVMEFDVDPRITDDPEKSAREILSGN